MLRWLRIFAALWDKLLALLKRERSKGRDDTIEEAHREEDRRVAEADDIAKGVDALSADERERLRDDRNVYRD